MVEHGLLDNLIRPSEHWRRDLQTELLRRLEVDHQFELGWLLDGKVRGLGAFEDLVRAMSGGRKITLACFSPADIGSKSIECYVGTLGERHHVITGSPDQVVHTLEDFRKSGLEHLALSFRDVRLFKDETPDLLLKQMRLFAREIMPAFRT